MLKRITVGILVIMMILAVGCGKTNESVKEEDGIAPDQVPVADGVAQDRVFVEFTVSPRDRQVSDLLDSLGSHVIETVYYSDRVQVTVPEGKTATDMVETLNGNPLVECAEPYYLFDPDQVVVQFKVAVSDSRVSALLESLGSRIPRTYEYSDFVLVSVPEARMVADIVESLNSSPLVEYAEPNYYAYI
jgi:hypothetical protein